MSVSHRLVDSPSSGHSEVLNALRAIGGRGRHRLYTVLRGVAVNSIFRSTDPQFATDLDTVLAALDAEDLIVVSGGRISLTTAGRIAARHLRPRSRHDPWRGP